VIDVYQLHNGVGSPAEAELVAEVLTDLVAAGKVATSARPRTIRR
jgi:aryl-alcohol dehydrogenase-like predicted oxidoreductase